MQGAPGHKTQLSGNSGRYMLLILNTVQSAKGYAFQQSRLVGEIKK